jgi:hypothetical protein
VIEKCSLKFDRSSADVTVHWGMLAVWVLFGVWGHASLTCMMWLMFPEITEAHEVLLLLLLLLLLLIIIVNLPSQASVTCIMCPDVTMLLR